MLAARVEAAPEPEPEQPKRRAKPPKPSADPLTDFLGSRSVRQLQREVVRGLFGMLRKRL